MGALSSGPGSTGSLAERTVAVKPVYQGRIVNLEVLEVTMPDGRSAVREVIRHRGAAAILAQRPDGRLVFVRQYRKAAEREFLEVIAGTREPGETAETCARREIVEETGYEARELYAAGSVFPSPGYSSEEIFLFFARLATEPGPRAPDADEQLETVCLTRAEFEDLLARGEISDGKTLAAWVRCARWLA